MNTRMVVYTFSSTLNTVFDVMARAGGKQFVSSAIVDRSMAEEKC